MKFNREDSDGNLDDEEYTSKKIMGMFCTIIIGIPLLFIMIIPQLVLSVTMGKNMISLEELPEILYEKGLFLREDPDDVYVKEH
jgi:hypothetical protein